MNTPLMPKPYQTAQSDPVAETASGAAPWAWDLPPQQARTLPASDAPRWLQVASGCVWLTRADGGEPADDIWLQAGQSLVLPASTAWVLEGWPQARLNLLLQGPDAAPFRRGRDAAQRPWMRRWRALAS